MGRSPLVDDIEVLRAVASHPDPVVTAEDLVPLLPYSGRRGINNRLVSVSERGLLRRKEVGAQAVVYWLSDAGQSMLAENLSSNEGSQ
jgi:hypothetical protein